jgi:hypothetical protein
VLLCIEDTAGFRRCTDPASAPSLPVRLYSLNFSTQYATSHEALDRDDNFQEEVRNAARTLMEAADGKRKGLLVEGGTRLKEPRPK